jgi:hypothetical protein
VEETQRKRRAPRRIVRAAMFEGTIGPITADELLAMDEDTWGHLRDIINDRRAADPQRPLAICLRCARALFIRAMKIAEKRLPLFVHFAHPELDCEWHVGKTISPDDARAAQYHGQQESELHRALCEKLAELLRADPRHRRSTVGDYHRPTESDHGRYPDVYAELEGVPPFTLELQLSRTFAPEIAARGRYYGREDVALIWVLYGIAPGDEDVPQSFRDVIRRHRGNAFIFDQGAMRASVEANTLVLRCFLKNRDGSFSRPRLVRLDGLTFPANGLPYFEDRRSPVLVGPAKEGRKRWLDAIAQIDLKQGRVGYKVPEFDPAYASLIRQVCGLREWIQAIWANERQPKHHFFAVMTVLFSIARTAHDGRDRNLATLHSGKGAMVAMLNTRLHADEYAPYATLIEAMLMGTSADRLLSTPSLPQHIRQAKDAAAQVLPGHPVWEAAVYLFPEVLRPIVREELESLGELPDWANPTSPISFDDCGLKRVSDVTMAQPLHPWSPQPS